MSTTRPISNRVSLSLYAAVGPQLFHYAVDVERVCLSRREEAVSLAANVQYACAHASRRYLYVVASNGGPGRPGDRHSVSAFCIDPETGVLSRHGDDLPLRQRPIHITTDIGSAHVLIAYNDPSTVTVHRLAADGSLGGEVAQPETLDTGCYAHQVCVTPSNQAAILVTRGNDPGPDKPEDPGALKVFRYVDGVLTNWMAIAPGRGCNFGPRNMAFSPSFQWIYVSLERQNQLNVFRFHEGTIAADPSFRCDTLRDPGHARPGQIAGTVHVHPNGHFVYVANRGGENDENTIVVYAIDQSSGRPRTIQTIDTQGVSPRTFSIDPSGRMLVAANSRVRPNLSVFSIAADGQLTHERRYAVTSGPEQLFWSAMV